MRELWKKALLLASLGFILGIIIGLIIVAVTGYQDILGQNSIGSIVKYLLSSGILGAVNMGTTVVYSIEHWGLLRTTLTHFCISMTSVCVIGFTSGWFSVDDAVTWLILAVCIVVYFIIWLIMYLQYKREIKRMNEALKRWKSAQKDD